MCVRQCGGHPPAISVVVRLGLAASPLRFAKGWLLSTRPLFRPPLGSRFHGMTMVVGWRCYSESNTLRMRLWTRGRSASRSQSSIVPWWK